MRLIFNIILASTLCLAAAASSALGRGDTAPPWTGQNLLDGAEVRFPEVLDGRPAVLLFWATWCPYCKAFMPYAKAIQAEYAQLGVQFITFNSKERGRGDPSAYVRSLDIPMIAIADADSIGEDYKIAFIPGLLVVDGQGEVVYRRASTNLPAGQTVASYWADQVRASLDKLLATSASASAQP